MTMERLPASEAPDAPAPAPALTNHIYGASLIVTNGGKNGILANHSNNLKVYLDDARQKMNSLITILDRG